MLSKFCVSNSHNLLGSRYTARLNFIILASNYCNSESRVYAPYPPLSRRSPLGQRMVNCVFASYAYNGSTKRYISKIIIIYFLPE